MSRFHQIFCPILPAAVGRSSFDGKSNTLRTSGFVDDVTFSRNGANGPESKTMHMFRLVCHVAAPGQSLPSPTASCSLVRRGRVLCRWRELCNSATLSKDAHSLPTNKFRSPLSPAAIYGTTKAFPVQ